MLCRWKTVTPDGTEVGLTFDELKGIGPFTQLFDPLFATDWGRQYVQTWGFSDAEIQVLRERGINYPDNAESRWLLCRLQSRIKDNPHQNPFVE